MKLNHLDLCVADVPAAQLFFESCFGFRCLSEHGKGALSVLSDQAGLTLVLSRSKAGHDPAYPGQFHIGFLVEDESQVEAQYARVQAAGAEIIHPLHRNPRGLTFFCRIPGSEVMAEVSHRAATS